MWLPSVRWNSRSQVDASVNLHLLNASMLHKKVVEEPMTLYQYLQQHSTHTGIRIIRILK